jgi:hypothetical protein
MRRRHHFEPRSLLRHCEARGPLVRHCEARSPLVRHCEARSAVAIHAFVRQPMDRFVPRDDGAGGVMTGLGRDAGRGRYTAPHLVIASLHLHCLIARPQA